MGVKVKYEQIWRRTEEPERSIYDDFENTWEGFPEIPNLDRKDVYERINHKYYRARPLQVKKAHGRYFIQFEIISSWNSAIKKVVQVYYISDGRWAFMTNPTFTSCVDHIIYHKAESLRRITSNFSGTFKWTDNPYECFWKPTGEKVITEEDLLTKSLSELTQICLDYDYEYLSKVVI